MIFPQAHWEQIYGTNPLERLNAEIKRRTGVVGICPNDAVMLEQNDEWSLTRRYMQLEGLNTVSDTAPTRLPAVARPVPRVSALSGLWTCSTRWDTTWVLSLADLMSSYELDRSDLETPAVHLRRKLYFCQILA